MASNSEASSSETNGTEANIKILFTNIGDNFFGEGLCTNYFKSNDTKKCLLNQQRECITKYLESDNDLIILQEVCAYTLLLEGHNNLIDNSKYHAYLTALKRKEYNRRLASYIFPKFYYDLQYKLNTIYSKKNKLLFDSDIIQQNYYENCIKDDITDHVPIDPKNPEMINFNEIDSKKIGIISENLFMIRYNWIHKLDNCILKNCQFGIYSVGDKKIFVINVHISPSKDNLQDVIMIINEFKKTNRLEYALIIGDFNFNHYKKTKQLEYNSFYKMIKTDYNIKEINNMGIITTKNINVFNMVKYPPCPPSNKTTNHFTITVEINLINEYIGTIGSLTNSDIPYNHIKYLYTQKETPYQRRDGRLEGNYEIDCSPISTSMSTSISPSLATYIPPHRRK